MWSHYADQYRGICLCYEIPDIKDTWEKEVHWSCEISDLINNHGFDYVGGCVKYKLERPSLEIVDSSLPIEQWSFKNDYNMLDAFFVKPEFWNYEKEWRMVIYSNFGNQRGFAAGIDTKRYFAEIPKKWLKEVVFGIRLDEQYREEIMTTIHDSGYVDVHFAETKMGHGEFHVFTEPYA